MKRRNVDCGKLRRPLKRNKITEGIYGSTVLYLKFLLLWAMVILADFILEFRFEFLWPFWLLLRSVYDSFKYQGLAFSVFFICIALTSDMICFFFIPVHWLFFAASTYVWVQYVWHTDKGVCLPTVMLWLLFLYIEAAVRLRDLRHIPFHLDLCRPFAAHCIGYPVVTLGFGVKSYVGYRMRQRRQKDVAKENEFYLQLLQQALPPDQQQILTSHQIITTDNLTKPHRTQYNPSPEKTKRNSTDTSLHNGIVNDIHLSPQNMSKSSNRKSQENSCQPDKKIISNGTVSNQNDIQLVEKIGSNLCDTMEGSEEKDKINSKSNNPVRSHQLNGSTKWNCKEKEYAKKGNRNKNTMTTESDQIQIQLQQFQQLQQQQKQQQDEFCQRVMICRKLEADVKRLKSDIQSSRQTEQELRNQINTLINDERQAKGDIQQLQHDNDLLQTKLQGLITARQLDKQTMTSLERRIAEERRQRTACEASLVSERRARRIAEEAKSVIPPPPPPLIRQECTDACKTRRVQMELDLKALRRELKSKDERLQSVEKDASHCKENHSETEMLLSAINALQEKNSHLENSLSAETRIKLDLFSALGEAKRQLEIRESLIRSQEKEMEVLKMKIAQDLAVMPQDSFGQTTVCTLRLTSDIRSGNSKLLESPCPGCTVSNLDPNATAYTPKSSLVASTEA